MRFFLNRNTVLYTAFSAILGYLHGTNDLAYYDHAVDVAEYLLRRPFCDIWRLKQHS